MSRFIILSSIFYLALPYVIFFVGWMQWYLVLLCLGLVALPLVCCIREINQIVEKDQKQSDSPKLRPPQIVLVILASIALLGISGVGGYGYQDPDWLKHNAILKDLIEQPWPVVYQFAESSVPLVYYIAFYLPTALFGKLGGWFLANQVLFAWSLIGLVLAMLWFVVLVRRTASTVFLLFVFFSGLDVIGEWLVTPIVTAIRPEYASYVDWAHIERWAFGWEYSSNATLLFWAPNQALAGWIASGVLVYTILYSSQKKYTLFFYALTALWSPFVTIGLVPYLLMDLILENGTLPERLGRYLTFPNLCGLLLLGVIGLFYSAKLYPISPLVASKIPHGFSLSALADAQGQMLGLGLILVFCLLEFGLYGVLIHAGNQDWNAKTKGLFATTIICLLLIPFYRYGAANDFAMRASIPALFVLAIFLGRALHNNSLTGPRYVILISLIIIGSATPAIEFHRHITNIVNAGTILRPQPFSQVRGLWSLPAKNFDTIILQYIGSSQTPFFTLIAKRPQALGP